MIEVKEVTCNRGQICDDLLRRLPLWFGIEEAIRRYALDVERMPMLAAHSGDRIVGFVSLNLHNEWTTEIYVMAIHPEFHRRGIGRKLIEAAETFLRKSNHQFLSVKTLSPSRPNKEYQATREFYLAMGFRPVEEFKTLWGEANPCLLMIKALE